MDELIDVVNEQDEVIAQEMQSVCHARGLLHRGGAVFIFRTPNHQELLLQKRSATKERKPNCWCQPGGHIAAGENYINGMQRELKEEMFHGMPMPKLEYERLFKMSKKTPDDPELITLYRTVYDGTLAMDPIEVQQYRFQSLASIQEDMRQKPDQFTETFQILFREYLKHFPIKKEGRLG